MNKKIAVITGVILASAAGTTVGILMNHQPESKGQRDQKQLVRIMKHLEIERIPGLSELMQQSSPKEQLVFRYGDDFDGEIILTGKDVVTVEAVYDTDIEVWSVQLEFTAEGREAFAEATARQAETGGYISVWLDDKCLTSATVAEQITDGRAVISGCTDEQDAKELEAMFSGTAGRR